jgi:chromosome partitioning protein
MPLTVSLVARKGGVGKTSTVMNLAGAALEDGASRVVVIDLDPQSSLSKALLGPAVVDQLRPICTVHSVLAGDRRAVDVVTDTPIPGLRIIPGYQDLTVSADATIDLRGLDADLILIDTPPDTKNPAVRAALLASHAVVSPLIPEALAMHSVHGIQQLLMSAGLVSNPSLMFAGWLVSMRQRIAMHDCCESTLRRLHGGTVFDTVIPSLAAFKEASAAGVPITRHAPKSTGAKVVRALWSELVDRVAASAERGAA